MSTDDSPEKLHEDGTVETPEWHRARAKRLRQNGFTKMAEQHEQIAQAIERRRQQCPISRSKERLISRAARAVDESRNGL